MTAGKMKYEPDRRFRYKGNILAHIKDARFTSQVK